MIYCTFAGHRQLFHAGMEEKVEAILNEIISQDTEFCFYAGGMGEFDSLCARCVRRMRSRYPEKKIGLILVQPYMKQSINENGRLLLNMYDEIIIPDALVGAHYKNAITLRNRWMVDQSQHLITYIFRQQGGAYATLRYAEKQHLKIHPTLT